MATSASISFSAGLYDPPDAVRDGLHAAEGDTFDLNLLRTKSVNPTPLKRKSSEDVSRLDRLLHRRVSLGGKCQGLHLDPETEQKAMTIGNKIAHAAAETYLITRLAFILLRSFGVGYQWIQKAIFLVIYAALLAPGFAQVGWYYFQSPRVWRSVVYGPHPRNRLDLYFPEDRTKPRPVVIFITGGAWIIGYKAWGALLGQSLSARGVIVACLDYRNFPQGTVIDMLLDVSNGISWVLEKANELGGDPQSVVLVGQSAGAHLGSLALLKHAIKEANGLERLNWSLKQIRAFVGVSGGYNLHELMDHFHEQGLYRSIFEKIMDGKEVMPFFSPEAILESKAFAGSENAAKLVPPVTLLHGTRDKSIPHQASERFAEKLKKHGIAATTRIFVGKSHTDPIIQDPLRGGKDDLMEAVLAVLYEGIDEGGWPAARPARRRMVPEPLIALAGRACPF
ncbi:alpha beta-hydrolases superfamily protein [Klebsormidium nitens]|uniref:protein-S-isoprenylcysteine alpha-carbonyl methylesterase n=1 Tax=Klebsormidium nitens TaxID=105231 RepID=A0A0U9HK16_KLENI|nr:alpha beta-hydrolases superfamily protein [Klebsormidium nitens]|eukprot:GAQ84700.1 alpha beta-hydrolases superfamily protein [Klebsormidium nitens]